MMPATSSNASSVSNGPTGMSTAPFPTASPCNVLRLVIRTRHSDAAGSNGRTCSALAALSSSTSVRRSAGSDLNSPVWASVSAGTYAFDTPMAARNSAAGQPLSARNFPVGDPGALSFGVRS